MRRRKYDPRISCATLATLRSCSRSRRNQLKTIAIMSTPIGHTIRKMRFVSKEPRPKQASGSPSPSSSRLTHENASRERSTLGGKVTKYVVPTFVAIW